MRHIIFSILVIWCAYEHHVGTNAQEPLPPRALIPGAIPLRPVIPGSSPARGGSPAGPAFRPGRLFQAGGAPRRPVPSNGFYRSSLAPSTATASPSTAATRPVSEEPEDDEDVQIGAGPQQRYNAFESQEQVAQKQALLAQLTPALESLGQPIAASPAPQPAFRPEPSRVPLQQQPIRQQRPQQIQRAEPPVRHVQQQVRPRPQPRPVPQQAYDPEGQTRVERFRGEKKPVSQTLRKYNEKNPDGSITWGYENDDGSFKEETIGVDCITRGKYGYVDPDGVRREYTYETGLPCDTVPEDQEAFTVPPQQQARRPYAGQAAQQQRIYSGAN